MRALVLSVSALAILLSGCASGPTTTERQRLREYFDPADLDQNEQLSPEEFATLKLPNAPFADVDSDDNGGVTLAELHSYIIWRRIELEGRRLPRERYGRPQAY